MTDYKKRLGTAIATVVILAKSYSGLAIAGTTININGNAADSDNDVTVQLESETNVTQNNTANFNNNKYGDANTGNNDANQNNGGDVNIQTGDASVTVAVSNWANANSARVGGNGNETSVSLKILDNAADSD